MMSNLELLKDWSSEELINLYKRMLLIREFEQRISKDTGKIKLEEENIHCEVIDPRTLVPMDKNTILNSVEKTGKLIIVDEGCKTCSMSAEVAAFVAEEGFQYLKKNIIRINTPDVPIPYSPKLEKQIVPNAKLIQIKVKKLI